MTLIKNVCIVEHSVKKNFIASNDNTMEKLEYIPVNLDQEEIRRRLHVAKSGDWAHAQTLIEEAQSLISAKAVYKACYIEKKHANAVTIDGRSLKSRVLRKNLTNVERVFPYVVTIGDRLEETMQVCSDLLTKYYFDTIGNVALIYARNYLKDHLRSRYALEGISYMSPGSLKDWAIEEQESLFSILGNVESSIGVRLNETLVMIPNKSLSGIYFPTEIPFYSCQLCRRENCSGRKAPYDKKLVRKYGIVE